MINAELDALRPRNFDEYIGQPVLKNRLVVAVQSALARNQPLGHVLLFGPPGTGKTSLAEVITQRLGQPMVVMTRPGTEKDLLAALYQLEQGVLFIDEIHRWPRASQECLLTLLEDGYVDTKWGQEDFPNVTVIAATTEREKVIAPVRDRFPIRPEWEPYTDNEMALIVKGIAHRADMELPDDMAMAFGRAGGGVPRNARSLVLAARDLYCALNTVPTIEEVLAFCQIGADGLTKPHMDYLRYLADLGGQAGLTTMAARLRMHVAAVTDIERLLVDRRLIGYEPAGRTLTVGGRRRLDGGQLR